MNSMLKVSPKTIVLGVLSVLFLALPNVSSSVGFSEGLYDGDRIVIAGVSVLPSDDSFLAITYGKDYNNLKNLVFLEVSIQSIADITYDASDESYIVSGSDYTYPSDYSTVIVRLNNDFTIDTVLRYEYDRYYEYSSHTTDDEGNLYVSGLDSDDGGNNNDMMIEKYDRNLTRLWVKRYGTPGNNDYSQSVKYDGENMMLLGEGYHLETEDFDPVLYKLDKDGEVIWKTVFGDNGTPDGTQELLVNSDGDYIVIGENPERPAYLFQFTVAKVSHSGELLHLSFHGKQETNDAGFSIRETPKGYIAVGYSDSYDEEGMEKRALAMLFDKELNYISEHIFPELKGGATDIVNHGGELIAIGPAKNYAIKGFVWPLDPIINPVSVAVGNETSTTKSYLVNKGDWSLLIGRILEIELQKSATARDQAELYNLAGTLVGSGESIVNGNVPIVGSYFLRLGHSVYSIGVIN